MSARIRSRTTLTLDKDVAVDLERLRKARDASLKDVVNETLRLGLRQQEAMPSKKRKPFRIRPMDLGELLIPIDNIGEALALAEGEDHK
jgi:hypothetical protein